MRKFITLACLLLASVSPVLAQTGTGLTGKYFDNADFTTLVTTRTDASINFNYGTGIPSSTAIANGDTFSIAWSGQIEPQYSELYTFHVTADDGARLWVDDQLIVQRTFFQGTGELRGQIKLKGGHRTNIRLEYIENSGNASVKLEWASASQPRQTVPTLRLYPTTEIPNGGSLMREVWTGLPGSSIATMTGNASYPNKPASREFITSFECLAQNWEDSFGTRVTGFIRAPISGSYFFAVSGDEVVQLYLSTDADPANKSLIASTTTATAFRDFSANASQQSAARPLVAGQKYYVELLHKEDTGADHWSVGWKQPGDTAFSIVPGTVLMMPGTDLATPSTANLFNTLATEHPRLGSTRERFLWLKQQYLSPTPSNVKTRAQSVVSQANTDVSANTRHYGNEIARLCCAWWLTGDSIYAEKVWTNTQETMATGDFTVKWKGNTLRQISIAYDWLYPYWDASRRTTLLNFLINNGLNSQSNNYGNNIGILNDSGFIMASLAVGMDNESKGESNLSKAVGQLVQKIDQWEPNAGAWLEGTDYGILAKLGLSEGMHSIETGLGSSFGVGRTPGFFTARREPLTIASNTRQRFTFSDVGTGSNAGMGWGNWWGRRFDAPEVYDYSRQSGNSTWNALLLPETTIGPAQTGMNPDTCFHGPADSVEKAGMQHVATLRQNWTDTKATFVGGMGGTYMSHGMLQSGTFQMSARGVKWFVDLTSESYEVPNHNVTTPSSGADRWDYYRNRAEGHNCLIVNPTSQPDRIWNAPSAPMTSYQSAQSGQRSFAVWDLSNNITGATKVQRGIQLLGQRKQVLIQDEIVNPTATTCWWFAHFPASMTTTIGADPTTIILQNGTERLWGKIVSGGGIWTVRQALPLPTSPAPAENADNSGYRKLAIQLNSITNTTLAVWFVPLAPGEVPPTTTPAITPLNTWNLVFQNEAPVVQNSGANSIAGAPVDVNLRAVTSDDWTPATQLTFAVSGAVGGTVSLQPDGYTARFTPTVGFTGEQGFSFTATDLDGATSSLGTVVIGTSPVASNWTSTVNGSWSTGANWQGGVAPASGRGADLRFFNGQTLGAATVTATNNLPGTTLANQLNLSGTGTATTVVNLDGNPLKLVRNGATPPAVSLTGSTAGFRYNIANAIDLDDDTTFTASGNGTFVFNGGISGSGGITRSGSTSTLVLAGNNSYAGPTTISSGTLQIGNDSTTGTLGVGPVSIASGATLRIDRAGTVDVPNDIGGAGALLIHGPAITDVVNLTGGNSFTGTVSISSGSLRITDAGQLGDGAKTITATSSTSSLRLDGTAAAVDLPASFNISTSNPNGAIFNEAGSNSIGGSVTLTGGAGATRITSLAGTLTIEGNVAPNFTGRSLDLRGAGNGVINGNVLDGSGANTLGTVSKNDAGTWTLNGINAFTGATTVSAGKLVINGPHTSGAVTVAAGATLTGGGSLTAATTINGTLAPGDRFGTMNIGNTVSFGSTGHLQWELGTNSLIGDKLIITGAVSVAAGAKIDVALNSSGSETTYTLSFWRNSRTFPVLSCASLSGTFSLGTVTGDAMGHSTPTYGSFALQHTATGVNLVWTPVPGFPIIDEPLVSFIRPSASPASLPYVSERLRVTATAAGGGTTSFVWSAVADPEGGSGTVTFANPNAADTTVTFSEKGSYILRCTATNEAVSRSADLIVLVEPDTTLVLQEDLNGYTHSASYIQANSTAWNHGTDEKMYVGRNSNAAHRAVLSFGLDGVPAGATIQSAKLDLWTAATLGLGNVGALDLHQLTRDFQQGSGDGSTSSNGSGSGVTWATYDGTNTWTTAGGTYDPVKLATVAGYDASIPHVRKTFVSSALGAAVQSAASGSGKLNLMVLSPTSEADTTANNFTVLKSNDSTVATERPALTLDITFNSLPLIDPGNTTTAGVGFPLTLNGVVSFANSNLWSVVSGPGTAAFGNTTSAATSVNFSAVGTYVLRLTAVNSLGEASADLTVNVSSSPPGFSSWQASNWPGVSDPAIIGPDADPDGDGVKNAIEFNAGTDPKSAASAPTFVWNRIGSGAWSSGGSWQLGVAPASNAATKLEFFTDLSPSGSINANNDISSNFILNSLAFKGAGSGTTTLSGGSLSFTAGALLDIASDGIGYTISTPISLGGALTASGIGNDTVVFNGVVSGSGTLTKIGASTLSFGANNTMTSGLVLDGGGLRYTIDQTTALASLTFGVTNGSGNTSTLDLATTPASLTAGSLTARTASSVSNNLRVGSGKTLTITGAVDVSNTAASSPNGAKLVFNSVGAVPNSTFRVTGSGNFIVGKNSSTQSTTRSNVMDLRNVSTLNAGTGSTPLTAFHTGYYTAQTANYEDFGVNTTYLAPSSVIYATTFGVADMNGGVGGQTQSTLYLGAGANEIHTTTLTIGEAQDLNSSGAGTIKWNSGVTTGSLALAGTGTTPAVTNMYVGIKTDTGSTYHHTGTADFTNGTVTGSITNLYVGYQTANGGSSSPQTFGTFKIGGGSGGSSALTISNLYLGYQSTNSTTYLTNGAFEIGGGNVSVTNNVEMTHTAGGVATLNVLGGTLSVGGNITSLGGASTLTLNGGTLDMDGGAIGTSTNPITTVSLLSGTLKNLGSINGSADFVKTGAGTVSFDGTNNFTGNLTVSAGSLVLADNAQFRIAIQAATSNKLTGAGSATLNGNFFLDLTNAAPADGKTWTLVDVAARTYGPAFAVKSTSGDFSNSDGFWMLNEVVAGQYRQWSFSQSTGVLSVAVSTATPGLSNWISAASGTWSSAMNWGGFAPASSTATTVSFFNGLTAPAGSVTATNDLAGITQMNVLKLSGAGTPSSIVNLTGNALQLVTNGTTAPVVQLDGANLTYNIGNAITLDSTATFTGTGNGTFAFNGPFTGTGGIIRNGSAGTLILTGSNSYTGTTTVGAAGTLTVSGSGVIAPATGATLTVGSSGAGSLLYTSSGTSRFAQISIGNGTNSPGTLIQTAGTINATALVLSTGFSSGAGTLSLGNASGTTATMNVSGNATVSAASSGSASALTINATGTLAVTGTLGFGTNTTRSANGVLTQAGTVSATTLRLNSDAIGAGVTHTSLYHLNAGTSSVGSITSGSASSGGVISNTFNFNGGTLKPTAGSSTFFPAIARANVRNGGAIINSDFNVTIAQPLDHSNIAGDSATDGGFTKSGTGTVMLDGVNTYTGVTRVLGGTLALGSAGSIDTSPSVTIAAGAVMDVSQKATFAPSSSQPITLRIDGTGAGSCGRIQAADLNISNANVHFEITSPLDDPVYVLAIYTSKTGSAFTSVTPPAGYSLDYAYNGNQIALVPTNGYAGWINGHPGLADNTPTGDPDHDGMENLLEYVLGGNPTLADVAILPAATATATHLVLTFLRRDGSETDTTQSVQYGTNFSGWSDVPIPAVSGVAGAVAITITENGTAPDLVTVHIPNISLPLFARLKVTRP